MRRDQKQSRYFLAFVGGLVVMALVSNFLPSWLEKWSDSRGVASFDENSSGKEIVGWASDQEEKQVRALAGQPVSALQTAMVELFPKGTRVLIGPEGLVASIEFPPGDPPKKSLPSSEFANFLKKNQGLFTNKKISSVSVDDDDQFTLFSESGEVLLKLEISRNQDNHLSKIQVLK